MSNPRCYQCDKQVPYLFDDSRCHRCTRLTIEQVTGEDPMDELSDPLYFDYPVNLQQQLSDFLEEHRDNTDVPLRTAMRAHLAICPEWRAAILRGCTWRNCPNPAEAMAWSASVLIQLPWPAAEPFIARDAKASYTYAREVIRGRWPRGEKSIMYSPWASRYVEFVGDLAGRGMPQDYAKPDEPEPVVKADALSSRKPQAFTPDF